MVSTFEILSIGTLDTDPLSGVSDLTNLVSTPKDFHVKFRLRKEPALMEALEAAREGDS